MTPLNEFVHHMTNIMPKMNLKQEINNLPLTHLYLENVVFPEENVCFLDCKCPQIKFKTFEIGIWGESRRISVDVSSTVIHILEWIDLRIKKH
jgi:hypothetical protein